MGSFTFLDHTADVKFEARGGSFADLLAACGRATVATLSLKQPSADEHRRIHLDAKRRDSLLIEWLDELITIIEDEGLFFAGMEVYELTDTHLDAQVSFGELPPEATHGHIKAATHHELELKESDDGWHAVVVLDV